MEGRHRSITMYWTEEEDKLLVDAVERHGRKWDLVSSCVPKRDSEQCKWHYRDLENKGKVQSNVPKRRCTSWSTKEDKALMDAVKRHGRNWQLVSMFVPNKNEAQCCSHYGVITKAGDSTKKSTPWTIEEDKLLLKAMQHDVEAIDGRKPKGYWDQISAKILGRSGQQCIDRYRRLHVKQRLASSASFAVGENDSQPGEMETTRQNPSESGHTGVAATTSTTTTATTRVGTNRAGGDNNNRSSSNSSLRGGNHNTVQEDELAKLKGENGSLKEKKAELEQALKSALADAKGLEERVNNSMNEAVASKAEAVAAMEEAAKWKAEAENFKQIMFRMSSDSESKIQQLQAQLADAVGTINTLKSEKESATSTNELKIQKLQEDITGLLKTVDHLQQEKKVALEEIAQKESALTDSRRQNKRQVSRLQNEIHCFKDQNFHRMKAELKAEEVSNNTTIRNNPSTLTGAEEYITADGGNTSSTFQSSSLLLSQSLPSNHVADNSNNNTHANSDNDFEASHSPKRRRCYPNAVDL